MTSSSLNANTVIRAGSAIATGRDWREVTGQAIEQALADFGEGTPDLALVFASADWADHFPGVLAMMGNRVRPARLMGCSGQAIIGRGREVEGEPAVSVLLLRLPGATLTPLTLNQLELAALESPADWHTRTGLAPEQVNAWLVLADPFRLDCEKFVSGLTAAYRGIPVVGGVASGSQQTAVTHLFQDGQVLNQGAIALAIGGAVTVRTVVAQGCQPIGDAWTITGAEGSLISEIAGRPALEVLVETLSALEPPDQQRARRNLLVGLAVDEYRTDFQRGDFLIRNLLGIDQRSGSLAVGAMARVGQTIQFQLRDAEAADEDLRHLLNRARTELGDLQPGAALLCSCNGRGRDLFGTPDHDAAALAEQLAPMPVAGFFCNGEIGPVGSVSFLHGFTASIALFVPAAV